jgi:hypothetical protein
VAYTTLFQATGEETVWKSGGSNIVHPSTVYQIETETEPLATTKSACSWNKFYAYIPPEDRRGGRCLDQNVGIWHPTSTHQSSTPMATNSALTSKLGKHSEANFWQIIQ